MFKILSGRIGEYKKATILTPLYMVGEVAMECLIPTVMAVLIDRMESESVLEIAEVGLLLFGLACVSLFCGIKSARYGAMCFRRIIRAGSMRMSLTRSSRETMRESRIPATIVISSGRWTEAGGLTTRRTGS